MAVMDGKPVPSVQAAAMLARALDTLAIECDNAYGDAVQTDTVEQDRYADTFVRAAEVLRSLCVSVEREHPEAKAQAQTWYRDIGPCVVFPAGAGREALVRWEGEPR